MKLVWPDPDLTQSEARYILFTWWDELTPSEQTPALIKSLALAGVDVSELKLSK